MENTTEIAAIQAKNWCINNPGWQRICDIPDTSVYNIKFEELKTKERKYWEKSFPSDPEGAWKEFGIGGQKIKTGCIGANGKFYDDIIQAFTIDKQNIMTVYKTGNS